MNLYLVSIYYHFGATSNPQTHTVTKLVKAENKQHAAQIVQRYINDKLDEVDAQYIIHDTLE